VTGDRFRAAFDADAHFDMTASSQNGRVGDFVEAFVKGTLFRPW